MPDAPKALVTRAAPFSTRAANDDGFTLEGYAAVFDTPTRIDSWEGRFDEQIARGAFTKTLSERKPVMQFDHGLFVSARMFDNPRVEPIRQAIAGGAIDGMSFRFRVTRESWDESRDVPMRTIRELSLFEVGPVVFPAYEATSVGVRSLLAELDPTQRAALLAELGVDAVLPDTSTPDPDAVLRDTSGPDGRDPRAVLALARALRARPRP